MVLFLCLCNVLRSGGLSDEEGEQRVRLPPQVQSRRGINGKTRHGGTVDIIGDGLKTEVFNMAENTVPNTPNEQTPPATTPNYDEIFSKLDAILDKRSEGLAKSALKDNGIEESEKIRILRSEGRASAQLEKALSGIDFKFSQTQDDAQLSATVAEVISAVDGASR